MHLKIGFDLCLCFGEAFAEIFPGGQRRHFAYLIQVADVATQTDVHKTLYCFYTTKKMPYERTGSIRIHFEIFFKWSCRLLYEFATKVYFLPSATAFAELAHKCRYHCELHTTESGMDLNYQHLRLLFSH